MRPRHELSSGSPPHRLAPYQIALCIIKSYVCMCMYVYVGLSKYA